MGEITACLYTDGSARGKMEEIGNWVLREVRGRCRQGGERGWNGIEEGPVHAGKRKQSLAI